MNGEFTANCNRYYRTAKLISEHNERLKTLLDNALPYSNQTNLSDLDAIIRCNRKLLTAKEKVDKYFKELKEAKSTILKMMAYFEIPPRKILTGVIPGEMEYKVWADKDGEVYIVKTRELQPEPEDPNVIIIKCCMSRTPGIED